MSMVLHLLKKRVWARIPPDARTYSSTLFMKTTPQSKSCGVVWCVALLYLIPTSHRYCFFPTIYTLYSCAHILYNLHTHTRCFAKIQIL